jgi:CHAD domain-containing protein
MPIPDAAKAVLAARFEVVRHYLPLAVEKPYEDVEHVHQLRVGTRRAAAALRVFADALPRKHLKETRRTLRTIRRAAGDARDWDVFLVGLPTAKPLAAAAAKPTLDFLLGYAFGERAAAQTRLAEAASEAGPLFVDQSLDLPTRAHKPQGPSAPADFGALAGQYLGDHFGEFTAAAEANPTETPALHALRIQGKRLRYAIEIFADCFPPVLKQDVYPLVERLQEELGDVQDAVVGMERLTGIRDRVQAVMPAELPRVRKGIDGLMAVLKAKVPAGKKAFVAWRKEWLALMKALKLEVLKATITA